MILVGFSGYHTPGPNFMYKGFQLKQGDKFQIDTHRDMLITSDCRVAVQSVYGHLADFLTPELKNGMVCKKAFLSYEFNGNLVLRNDNGRTIWHSNTENKGFYKIAVKNNKFIFS